MAHLQRVALLNGYDDPLERRDLDARLRASHYGRMRRTVVLNFVDRIVGVFSPAAMLRRGIERGKADALAPVAGRTWHVWRG